MQTPSISFAFNCPPALRLLLVAIALLAAAACAPVDDKPVLRVIATDPGTETILGAQQRFHVKFALDSKAPLTVTLEPYFQHEPLSANLGTSAPVALPAGGGTAVAHLFFWGDHATRVDELRLVARAPRQKEASAEFALPVRLSWVARELPPREPAPWVGETPQSAAAAATPMSDERSRWLAFGVVIIAIAIAGFGSRWLRGRWRAGKHAEQQDMQLK